ncbi:MAG TPA: YciI family protein [Bacteroidales bacterium]|nr:YciI family protein [Bacteroidales bacterium]HPS51844.1 YciI family protein [Bacteroidales bacterium]
MFAAHSVYLKPVEEVDKYLDAHRAYVKSLYEKGIAICSGPKIPRTGGFILMKPTTKEEALEIIKHDPYVIHGVARYDVIEFEVRSRAEGSEKFL